MKILINMSLTEMEKQKFMIQCPLASIEFNESSNPLEIEGIVGKINKEDLNKYPNLKWVQVETAGVDKVLEYLSDDILLTNASGAYGYAISEVMIGATYALMKNFMPYHKNQLKHHWERLGEVKDVGDSTILAVGLGDIGSRYAKKMALMGCRIIGVRRTYHDKPEYVDELITLGEIDHYLDKADIVALSLPSTKETENYFNYSRLKKMKQGAIILNVGRGNAIVTDDLVKVLKEGHLAGAYLDVTVPEPLNCDSELWEMDNVLITPHSSGNYSLARTKVNVINICIENINRYVSNSKLINVVDHQIGYRKNV